LILTSNPSSLSEFLTTRLKEISHRKSELDVASDAGFENWNTLSLLKNGSVKLPLDLVPEMAAALDTDTQSLFRLALAQYSTAKSGEFASRISYLFEGSGRM
jgi:hypothetical protein